MKEQIKSLRVQIDTQAQLVEEMRNSKLTTELSMCHKSLLLGKAWLGMVLAEIGEPTPYKNDGNRSSVNHIEPTADTENSKSLAEVLHWSEKNHIERVDALRQEIKKVIDEVKGLTMEGATREFAIARTNSYNHLCEARFWLGFELQRIKEDK